VTKTQSAGPISCLEHRATRVLRSTIVTRAAVLMFPVLLQSIISDQVRLRRLRGVSFLHRTGDAQQDDHPNTAPAAGRRSAATASLAQIMTMDQSTWRSPATPHVVQQFVTCTKKIVKIREFYEIKKTCCVSVAFQCNISLGYL